MNYFDLEHQYAHATILRVTRGYLVRVQSAAPPPPEAPATPEPGEWDSKSEVLDRAVSLGTQYMQAAAPLPQELHTFRNLESALAFVAKYFAGTEGANPED